MLLPYLLEFALEGLAPREGAVLIEARLYVAASLVQPELIHELVRDLLLELLGGDDLLYRLTHPLGGQGAVLLPGELSEHERIDQLAYRLGLDVTPRARFLPYGRPGDDYQKNAPVAPGTFLFKLAGEIDRVSRNTGLPPDALTGHIFTGGTPLLPRVRRTNHEKHARLPSGELTHLRSVTLTFHTADLTFAELRTIYDGIKTYMGGKGVQAPTSEDLEFWELVEDMGGPPEPYQGVREFWRRVLEVWNQKHPNRAPLKSWEGLQDRYRRLRKRLGIQ